MARSFREIMYYIAALRTTSCNIESAKHTLSHVGGNVVPARKLRANHRIFSRWQTRITVPAEDKILRRAVRERRFRDLF